MPFSGVQSRCPKKVVMVAFGLLEGSPGTVVNLRTLWLPESTKYKSWLDAKAKERGFHKLVSKAGQPVSQSGLLAISPLPAKVVLQTILSCFLCHVVD